MEQLRQIDHSSVEIPLKTLISSSEPSLKEVYMNVRRVIRELRGLTVTGKADLIAWYAEKQKLNAERFNDKLFSDTAFSPIQVEPVSAQYEADALAVDGQGSTECVLPCKF